MSALVRSWVWLPMLMLAAGCATMKESDTARTGVEQLLISSATDRALDQVDLQTVRGAKVFLETKYLDCVDKNYVIVSMRQRLMQAGCVLVDKPEDSQVTVEMGSGAVGTDRHEMFVGIPEIPLPPPSPIAIPRLPLLTRAKATGTVKLRVYAFESQTKVPVFDAGVSLARSDYKHWNVLGAGPLATGQIPDELSAATGESESIMQFSHAVARRNAAAAPAVR